MPETPLDATTIFNRIRDQAAFDKVSQETFELRQDEIKLKEGALTEEQVSRQVNSSRVQQGQQRTRERQSKQRSDQIVFMMLLDQIRERLDELQDRMAERFDVLKGKYGEHVIDGMVAAYLPATDITGMGEEEKLRALADKFLDEDGKVKAEYAHLDEAQYIRDWNELLKHQALLEKYDNIQTFTPEQRQELVNVAQSLPNVDKENLALAAKSAATKETVDQTIDAEKATQETIKAESSVIFR